ncbi:hypothetical protein [Psychromonas ossibalaenae]|uniref:hypothetical protein n=1 Tax=Psychromonas ossibalaenae TaxID=444922 RepID=UPI0003750D06|nr:hypothetical protein [Psychromonas ossibalaenae]
MTLKNILCISLLTLFLSACSDTQNRAYNNSDWWYDDYYYYWSHHHHDCCYSDQQWDLVLKEWWSSLDGDKQKKIAEHIKNNIPGDKQPDSALALSALKHSLNNHWQNLPEEKRESITAERETYMQTIQKQQAPEAVKQPKSISPPNMNIDREWPERKRPVINRKRR